MAHEPGRIQHIAADPGILGQMMGVQRNAISIVAHQLQQAGTIRYSRGQVAIANVEALRKSACECYHAVKAAHDRLLSAR